LKTKISVILGIAILLIGYTVFTNPANDSTSKVFAQKRGNMTSLKSSNITKTTTTTSGAKIKPLNITKATGNFGSLQNDQTGKPAWIVVGRWMMTVSHALTNAMNLTANSAAFNTTGLWMVKLDGTSKHQHNISDFKLTSSSINKNISATFNGTATITMKEGPVKDVPISIKFRDSGAASLWIDPVKTQRHFGNTPIYSFVWKTR
jgi:hypothetical protein